MGIARNVFRVVAICIQLVIVHWIYRHTWYIARRATLKDVYLSSLINELFEPYMMNAPIYFDDVGHVVENYNGNMTSVIVRNEKLKDILQGLGSS